ncbi:MAG: hypothetical protein HY332_09655, partial [Chloroflexi bacterium]|nr:hypothetical protein [Chloroflexota bacterium]
MAAQQAQFGALVGGAVALAVVVCLVLARRRLGVLNAAAWLVTWGALVMVGEHPQFAISFTVPFESLAPEARQLTLIPHARIHFFMAGINALVVAVLLSVVAHTLLREGRRAGWYAVLFALLFGGAFELVAGAAFDGFVETIRRAALARKVGPVELGVFAVAGEQFGVGALLDEPAVAEHDDTARDAARAETMGDEHEGAPMCCDEQRRPRQPCIPHIACTGDRPGNVCRRIDNAASVTLSGLMGSADLHVHSAWSDGMASVREIMEFAEAHTDLDVLAIADHDQIG